MINFFDVDFDRIAAHRIIPKTRDTETGNTLLTKELMTVSPDTKQIIQDRLYDAVSSSKYFQLAVDDASESGFFGYSKDLHDADDNKFLNYSGKIAELLAESMKSSTIPGGYLLVVQGKTDRTGKKVIVAIKADVYDVVTVETNEITIIEEVFLSPTKKFLKFGLLFEYNEPQKEDFIESEYPNNNWGAFIFDQQFRPESRLAEYFYRDFLGFTSEFNPKIQSRQFYNETEKFIISSVLGLDEKKDFLDILDFEFTMSHEPELIPTEFADRVFEDRTMNLDFKDEVASWLPEKIEKDSSLIKSKLFNKKLIFPNKIKLAGSKDAIEANVEVNPDLERITQCLKLEENFTVLIVKGQPYEELS